MTIQEILDNHRTELDEYEERIGLPLHIAPGETKELQEYLLMNRDQLEKMSPERIWAISARLSQFAWYIQRSLNRARAITKHVSYELGRIVAGEIQQYDKYMKHETKVYQIGRTNKVAASLLSVQVRTEERIERLTSLAEGIKDLSYVLRMGYKLKIGERDER